MLAQSCNKDKVDFDELIERYSKEKKDSLKLQCAIFLKDNIKDITSEQPYFYNENKEKANFILDTVTSDSSLKSILKKEKIDFSSFRISDADILSSEILEDNINKAISDWKTYPWNKNVSKDIFLNYLLPYKVLCENPENWRGRLFLKYKDSIAKHERNGDRNSEHLYYSLKKEAWSWLKYTNDFTKITQSPSLSELLAVKKGQCYELSHLFVYIARSAGIPATIDIVPLWGKTGGSHAADVFYGPIRENGVIKRYGLRPGDPFVSPPKVLRMSFRKVNLWSDSIKPIIVNKNYYIPDFLKSDHLLDVTQEYVSSSNLVYQFEKRLGVPLAYICVYNYGEWVPVFYGRVFQNGKYVKFNAMAKDMAYHIAVPIGNKYQLIDKPFILDSMNHISYSNPNFDRKINIVLNKTNVGQESWVKKNREYNLMFLDKDNVWKGIGSKFCDQDSTLTFTSIPSGAFYMLKETKNNKKLERIFLYEHGQQIWY